MEGLFLQPGSWFSVLGSLGLVLAGHAVRKYVLPFLTIGRRERYARYIARIADDVTDDLRGKYPEKEWLRHLDEAVDRLISICGIAPDVARRAVNASVVRK